MTIKVNTPCLITCIKELNEPRYMSVGGIFECYEKPYEVLDYNALKDDPLIDPATIGLKGSPTNLSLIHISFYKSWVSPRACFFLSPLCNLTVIYHKCSI